MVFWTCLVNANIWVKAHTVRKALCKLQIGKHQLFKQAKITLLFITGYEAL